MPLFLMRSKITVVLSSMEQLPSSVQIYSRLKDQNYGMNHTHPQLIPFSYNFPTSNGVLKANFSSKPGFFF